jgi:hypothetical protein
MSIHSSTIEHLPSALSDELFYGSRTCGRRCFWTTTGR